jgi:hypothetical protein
LVSPFLSEKRPEHLIVVVAVAQERSSENTFLHRTELSKCAVAAAVRYRRARLEALDPNRIERKVEHELRALHERPGAPVPGAEREAPLTQAEPIFECTQLEQPNRCRHPFRNDAEANIVAVLPFPDRPLDESLKPSTVVGGGEIKRATSSVVNIENSVGASSRRSSRSVTRADVRTGSPLRQSGVVTSGAGTLMLAGTDAAAGDSSVAARIISGRNGIFSITAHLS